jgi:glyoxylase-like metal-dependent hydrolase (beta-lactamase superfamily II)
MRARVIRGPALVAAVAGLMMSAAHAQQQARPDPRASLDEAVRALGGDTALARGADFEAEHRGRVYATEQGRDPADAFQTALRTYRWTFDADGGRVRREAELVFPGAIRFFTTAVVTEAGGWSIDELKWRTGTDLATIDTAAAAATQLPFQRFFPHLLLRQARAAGESLKVTPEGGLSYRDAAGEEIELAIDPLTGLITKASVMKDGVAQSETLYGDYHGHEGLMAPRSVLLRSGGATREDLRLQGLQFAVAPNARFQVPPGYQPPPTGGAPLLRPMAKGVWVFDNMPGEYHSMAVDLGDHLILLEAPLSPAYGEAQKRLLADAAPGKPVRYVVVTHAHGDHTGGLKPWVDAGAVILVAEGAAIAVRRQLASRGVTRPVTIEEVGGRRTLGAGAGKVDLYPFDNAHARSSLMAHLPGPRLLFHGDMLYVPERGGVPPAFPITREFLENVQRRRLLVEWFVGVHGRPATIAEARASVRRGSGTAR